MTDTGAMSSGAGGRSAGRSGPPGAAPAGPWRTLAEPRFVAWATLATLGSLLAFGLVSAIIPNPIFGREIPPEPFAIVIWLASAPLMGVILATYLVPAPAVTATMGAGPTAAGAPGPSDPAPAPAGASEGGRSLLGYAGGFAAFLAIGCPVCNKIVLVALGTTGALTIWAPLQPLVGAASLVLLAGTLAWRLRVRARGGVCSVA
jgi:hypothetical protein